MANKVPLVIADFETQISGAISAGDTSFTLASATDDDGNALAAGKYCFTVNNGRSNKQYLLGQLNGTAVTSVVSVDRRGNETSGAASAARSGSPVVISDFATIQRVADILRGQETLDGDNPIIYDAEPTLADRKEVATVAYVLDNVNGGTVNFDNQIISSSDATAGETVAAGDWVFFQTSDQEWYQIDADTAAEVDAAYIGVALGAGTDGASITGGVQISGVFTTTGLTAGDIYYLSNTPGEITNSAGTTERAIGVALSSTKLLMNFNEKRLPTATEKGALAGGGDFGTPSSTNKFLTEDYIPTIPKTQKIATSASTTEVANNTTTETNVFEESIGAGLLGTTNALKFRLYISNLSWTGAVNLTIRMKYGGTTVATLPISFSGGSINDLKGYIEGVLIANSSTSAQQGVLSCDFMQNQADGLVIGNDTNTYYTRYFASGTAAEDSTGALNLALSVQWSGANATHDFVPAGYVIELVT